jgi:hypothetical protein
MSPAGANSACDAAAPGTFDSMSPADLTLLLACPSGHRSTHGALPGERIDAVCPSCGVRFQALCCTTTTLVRQRSVSEQGRRLIMWSVTLQSAGQPSLSLNFTAEAGLPLRQGERVSVIWVWLSDRRLVLCELVRHDAPAQPSEPINLAGRSRDRSSWAYDGESGDGFLPEPVGLAKVLSAAPAAIAMKILSWVALACIQALLRAWPILLMLIAIWLIIKGVGSFIGSGATDVPTRVDR